MTNQYETLRLADALQRCDCVDFDGDFLRSAAELRRLHDENKALLAALKQIEVMCSAPPNFSDATIQEVARAAIAKVEGSVMNTDRELLELAAKAAGDDIKWDSVEACWYMETDDYLGKPAWNPLTDDGDALTACGEVEPLGEFEPLRAR